jgi:hypothetical protein
MIPEVVAAEWVRDFVIHLRFADGTAGDADLEHELDGPVFEPLKNPEYFRAFAVHEELRTLTWPNGADFAPEFLYEKVQVLA